MRLFRPLHGRLKIIVTVIASIMALYVGLSVLGAAASMRIPRLPLNDSPDSAGLVYQDVSFISRIDSIRLKGWLLPASRESVLVIVHGGYQNRVDHTIGTLDLAYDLVQKGYNLLLFDLRGRGESAGVGYSLSNFERDIGGAVDYLKSIGYQAEKIGIIGYCSGAVGACIFASREIIGGLVLDGCFISVQAMFNNQASSRGIPRLFVDIFLPGVQLAARLFYGHQPVNPIDVVGEVKCPILFIHEEEDNIVSTGDNMKLMDASGRPTNSLWQVEGTAHSEAYRTYPVEYIAKLDAFFRVALDVTGQTTGVDVTR